MTNEQREEILRTIEMVQGSESRDWFARQSDNKLRQWMDQFEHDMEHEFDEWPV